MSFYSNKSTSFSEKRIFDFNGKRMDFTVPRVMGILNVTPDSFYEAGRRGSMEAGKMIAEGAYIIDLGAVSTRPGAAEVSIEEEKKRLLPLLKEIRKTYAQPLSNHLNSNMLCLQAELIYP